MSERTGWRDMALSERHRKWGWNCPAVDLDFLFLEYDRDQPVALVDYIHELTSPQWASRPTPVHYQAMINLGNRAGIPVFAAWYKADFSEWSVMPLNGDARGYVAQRTAMSEREWVTLLYRLRGYTPPDELFDGASIRI